jgi:hypothetical protein
MDKPFTMFSIDGWSDNIEEVPVIRETEKTLILAPHGMFKRERKASKDCRFGTYFRTREEAIAELVRRRLLQVENAEKALEYAKKALVATEARFANERGRT